MLILFKWSLNSNNALYAVARMLIQLLLIGYFLSYIFESDSGWIVLVILMVMVFSSSWIALGVITSKRSILLGGSIPLFLVTQGVLNLEPWYKPQFMIPLAGMIFANSMNSVSLAVERLNAEIEPILFNLYFYKVFYFPRSFVSKNLLRSSYY